MEKNELLEALKDHGKAIEMKNAEFQKAVEAATKESKAEVEKLKSEMETLENEKKEIQKQLDSLDIEIQKVKKEGTKQDEFITLEKGIKDLLNSPEFKEAKTKGFPANKSVFEIKAATTDITGTVNMTQGRESVNFPNLRALAFLPYLNGGVVGKNRNRVLWVEGAYTSNVGYVSEGTGQSTADSGTATEKSRAMAKISAKLPLTAELLEDADYIASAFRMKMQENSMIFVDGELYDGDGDDSVNTSHIYGIQGHATAFNATTAGAAASVEKANIGDLIDTCVLQAEKSEYKGLNKVWMNPSDFFKMKKTKDTSGDYIFVKDINGNYTINGLQVIRSQKVTANTLLVADASKIQLWWKRNPEIKFSQMNGTDFVDDAFTAVMFLRCQLVVEAPDKKALIYVSDITAAINAINKAV